VRILRALVEWYMQTAPHTTPADPEAALHLAGGEVLGGRDNWGQLQSLKRGQDDSADAPADLGLLPP
jgi:hypothetical protein